MRLFAGRAADRVHVRQGSCHRVLLLLQLCQRATSEGSRAAAVHGGRERQFLNLAPFFWVLVFSCFHFSKKAHNVRKDKRGEISRKTKRGRLVYSLLPMYLMRSTTRWL
jgi:hypothetical protein